MYVYYKNLYATKLNKKIAYKCLQINYNCNKMQGLGFKL